jgi:aspartyl-tRNA(Asn)/glutamyl-tRNA(Gln) amidotransferase subunit B
MAVSDTVRKKYTPTIGIETHVQLNTKTKLFSAVGNDARQAKPNSLISHIDVGLPGALPVLNEKALELAVRAAFALNTQPQKFSKFDRKHYFYPDLPKGYQITQYENPIIIGGHVDIDTDGQTKRVNITRVHLEEDAGKNIHPEGADYSLVDLNRAGTPLLEIVSEPDIHSAGQAKAYARELYLLMKYAQLSDADLYHGNMRFDVNVSVSQDPAKLGKRAEVKNLNSFRSVENAVNYEVERQIELLEKGQPVRQETRGWNEATQKTTSQRGKEEAHDYRYMPEPDIPPVELSNEFIQKVKEELPKLPSETRKILNKLSIEPEQVEDLLDRPEIVNWVLKVLDKAGEKSAKRAAFWKLHTEAAAGDRSNEIIIEPARIAELSSMVDENKLSSTAARRVFEELPFTGDSPTQIAKRLNVLQVSDEAEIEEIVKHVLRENQQAAEDVKNGEAKAIGFLVGQVMAKSQGKANPQIARQIIKKQLGL